MSTADTMFFVISDVSHTEYSIPSQTHRMPFGGERENLPPRVVPDGRVAVAITLLHNGAKGVRSKAVSRCCRWRSYGL